MSLFRVTLFMILEYFACQINMHVLYRMNPERRGFTRLLSGLAKTTVISSSLAQVNGCYGLRTC